MGTTKGGRLWDVKHPYYAAEGNYFSNECHAEYESWAEYHQAEGSADPDLNLLYRWDWIKPDRDDYADDEPVPTTDTLALFYVGQRKALARSAHVAVTEADEPAVRAWLEERSKTITAIWSPIILGVDYGNG